VKKAFQTEVKSQALSPESHLQVMPLTKAQSYTTPKRFPAFLGLTSMVNLPPPALYCTVLANGSCENRSKTVV